MDYLAVWFHNATTQRRDRRDWFFEQTRTPMVKRTSLEKAECPIARSLDALGDWWSLLIIRDAFLGKRRFGEFQKSIGLAKNILTVRLRALVERGILTTAPASDGSAYQEYLLTPKGRGIFLRWRWVPHPAGRSRQRPTGAKTRTPRGGRPVTRQWRYRSAAEFRRQTPPARSGLSDASLTFKTNCACRDAECDPAPPS